MSCARVCSLELASSSVLARRSSDGGYNYGREGDARPSGGDDHGEMGNAGQLGRWCKTNVGRRGTTMAGRWCKTRLNTIDLSKTGV